MQIPLGNGLMAEINDDDWPLVSSHNWKATRVREGQSRYVYARLKKKDDPSRKWIFIHHLIAGKPTTAHIDHRDGNGLNNRRENLRQATVTQNLANQRRLRKDNTSGYKGVTFNAARQNWRAQIGIGGKLITLGSFDSPQAAAKAYDQKAIELFGEFAATNIELGRGTGRQRQHGK